MRVARSKFNQAEPRHAWRFGNRQDVRRRNLRYSNARKRKNRDCFSPTVGVAACAVVDLLWRERSDDSFEARIAS